MQWLAAAAHLVTEYIYYDRYMQWLALAAAHLNDLVGSVVWLKVLGGSRLHALVSRAHAHASKTLKKESGQMANRLGVKHL